MKTVTLSARARGNDTPYNIQIRYVPTLMDFPTLMGSDTLGGWVFVVDVTRGLKRRKFYIRC